MEWQMQMQMQMQSFPTLDVCCWSVVAANAVYNALVTALLKFYTSCCYDHSVFQDGSRLQQCWR
jgi:hypothetical protein